MTKIAGVQVVMGEKETVNEAVRRAARLYEQKYGRAPTLCAVHADDAPHVVNLGGITVANTVMPKRQVLVGVEAPGVSLD